MTRDVKRSLAIGLLFVLASFALGFATKIVEPGKWHQNHAVYFQQAEALLHGHFAIGTDPSQLKMDMAWHDGGVQQIWGLGIPLLMAPFQAVTTILPGILFPDRVFFLLLLAGLGGALYAALRNTLDTRPATALALVSIAFPPFVSLLLSRFQIWEEAVACEYIVVGYLLASVVSLAARPTGRKFMLLCAVAGMAPLVRPTGVFYSFAAALVGFLVYDRGRVRPAKIAGAGVAVAFAGFLAVTNHLRFGSAFEFGHSIHTNLYTLIDYTTTFENPFREATLPSATKDFLGSFVFTNIPGWKGFYESHLFPWQSPTFRWHEFYFRVFDASFLLLLGGAWIILGALLWRRRRATPFDPASRIAVALLLFSLFACGGLFVFYLRFFGMSSRFLVDFAPAILAAFLGLGVCLHRVSAWRGPARIAGLGASGALAIWLVSELALVSRSEARIASNTAKAVTAEAFRQNLAPPARRSSIPSRYVVSEDPRATNIPFNGVGWDHGSGETAPYAVFFIRDPQTIRLVFDTEQSIPNSAFDAVAVKVGLESLPRLRTASDGRYLTLEFARPSRPAYQHGIQMLSVRTQPASALVRPPDPGLALMEVNWNP